MCEESAIKFVRNGNPPVFMYLVTPPKIPHDTHTANASKATTVYPSSLRTTRRREKNTTQHASQRDIESMQGH